MEDPVPDDRIVKLVTEARAHVWGCGTFRASCIGVTNHLWKWNVWDLSGPSPLGDGTESRLFTAEARALACMRRVTGVNVVETASARPDIRGPRPDHPMKSCLYFRNPRKTR